MTDHPCGDLVPADADHPFGDLVSLGPIYVRSHSDEHGSITTWTLIATDVARIVRTEIRVPDDAGTEDVEIIRGLSVSVLGQHNYSGYLDNEVLVALLELFGVKA